MTAELLTVGHGTHPAGEFADLLRGAGVVSLVDVRIAPGSRRYPHFGLDALDEWLPQTGIEYRWERRLGGFRKVAPDSPDIALRNTSFRAYAGYMRTAEFRDALAGVLAEARARRTVVMCSESVWWRCHRRLIADAVELLDGAVVRHLMPDGRLADHPATEGVRVVGDALVYDTVASPPPTGSRASRRSG